MALAAYSSSAFGAGRLSLAAQRRSNASRAICLLLIYWKDEKKTADEDDKTIRDLTELLSKRVYISACLSFEREEINELHRGAGGVPGEITLEPRKSTEIENNMRNEIEENER